MQIQCPGKPLLRRLAAQAGSLHVGKGPSHLHPGPRPGLPEQNRGMDRKPVGGRTGASPAEGPGTPSYSFWEGGTTLPSPRMQGLDLPTQEKPPWGPSSTILECLCLPSSQAAPGTLARGLGAEVGRAAQLVPGLWCLSDLPVGASLGTEAVVAGRVVCLFIGRWVVRGAIWPWGHPGLSFRTHLGQGYDVQLIAPSALGHKEQQVLPVQLDSLPRPGWDQRPQKPSSPVLLGQATGC